MVFVTELVETEAIRRSERRLFLGLRSDCLLCGDSTIDIPEKFSYARNVENENYLDKSESFYLGEMTRTMKQ
jgi:hypothetical protein